MAKKLISYDDQKPGLGLPDVVEEGLNATYARSVNGQTVGPDGNVVIETGDPDAILGVGVGRVIASLDHFTPLQDGDLLLKLAPRPTRYFTDFTEYELGQAPSDWTYKWGTDNQFKVEEVAGATGGVALTEPSMEVGHNRALVWNKVGVAEDMETVMKWQTSHRGGIPRVAVRVSGETLPVAYHGGAQNANNNSIQKSDNSNTSSTLASGPISIDDNTWYISRLRVVGNVVSSKVWLADEPEPQTWDFEVEDPTPLGPGMAGIRIFTAPGDKSFDWVGIALGGETAPMQAV